MSSHKIGFVSIDFTSDEVGVGVGINKDPTALCQRKSEYVTFQRGAGRKFQGNSECKQYERYTVAMDVAVSQCCCAHNIKATTLQVARNMSAFQRGAGRKF